MARNPDPLFYDKWIEQALRSVIAQALSQVAEQGLPGEHHFYITFRTDADGIVLPERLRTEHGEEMTIVLQHQFWNLAVEDDAFSVTLKFRGRKERLRVPLAAITAFADPGVNFGLQLRRVAAAVQEAGEQTAGQGPSPDEGDAAKGQAGDAEKGEVIALDTFRKK